MQWGPALAGSYEWIGPAEAGPYMPLLNWGWQRT